MECGPKKKRKTAEKVTALRVVIFPLQLTHRVPGRPRWPKLGGVLKRDTVNRLGGHVYPPYHPQNYERLSYMLQVVECLSTPCQYCAILSNSLTVYDLVTLVDSKAVFPTGAWTWYACVSCVPKRALRLSQKRAIRVVFSACDTFEY